MPLTEARPDFGGQWQFAYDDADVGLDEGLVRLRRRLRPAVFAGVSRQRNRSTEGAAAVESDQTEHGCPACGVLAVGHGRRLNVVHDALCFGPDPLQPAHDGDPRTAVPDGHVQRDLGGFRPPAMRSMRGVGTRSSCRLGGVFDQGNDRIGHSADSH